MPLNPKLKVNIGDRQVRAFQLIDKFKFYVTPLKEGSDLVRVRVAPCLARCLQFNNFPPWQKAVRPLIVDHMLKAIPVVGGNMGDILEGFLRLRLTTVLTLFGDDVGQGHCSV